MAGDMRKDWCESKKVEFFHENNDELQNISKHTPHKIFDKLLSSLPTI